MHKAIILVFALVALAGCESTNSGQQLGTFKQQCQSANGKLTQVGPNDYQCVLPDGQVVRSR